MYIYLWIFTKSVILHVKHFISLTKRESVRRFFFCNTDPTLINTSTSDHKKHGKVQSIGDKKEKTSMCTHKTN